MGRGSKATAPVKVYSDEDKSRASRGGPRRRPRPPYARGYTCKRGNLIFGLYAKQLSDHKRWQSSLEGPYPALWGVGVCGVGSAC